EPRRRNIGENRLGIKVPVERGECERMRRGYALAGRYEGELSTNRPFLILWNVLKAASSNRCADDGFRGQGRERRDIRTCGDTNKWGRRPSCCWPGSAQGARRPACEIPPPAGHRGRSGGSPRSPSHPLKTRPPERTPLPVRGPAPTTSMRPRRPRREA